MGLDMYLFAERADEEEREELHYWRKHDALHGWMEKKYRELGGTETFNCEELNLTPEILDELEADIKAHAPVGGLFCAPTDYDPSEYEEDDLAAIYKAREYLARGWRVYYDSWW